MTILAGTVTKAESTELMPKMGIEPVELFRALDDDEAERVIDEYNEIRDDWNGDPVDTVDEFPVFVYEDWQEWIDFIDTEELVLRVLDKREQEYVHLHEGSMFGDTFHTVVEVYND